MEIVFEKDASNLPDMENCYWMKTDVAPKSLPSLVLDTPLSQDTFVPNESPNNFFIISHGMQMQSTT